MTGPAVRFVLLPVVAGTVVGVGLSLALFETVMRGLARVTGRQPW